MKAARNICQSFGYLPLALALASAYLRKNDTITLSDFCDRLEKEGGLSTVDALGIEYLDLPTRHVAAVEATLKIQWEALNNVEARRILQAAALGKKESLTPYLDLVVLTGLANKSNGGFPAPLREGLIDLQEWNLIEGASSQDGIRLQPMVRDFVTKIAGSRRALVDSCFNGILATLSSPLHLEWDIADRAVQMLLELASIYEQEFSDAYKVVQCLRQALAAAQEIKSDLIGDARWKLR